MLAQSGKIDKMFPSDLYGKASQSKKKFLDWLFFAHLFPPELTLRGDFFALLGSLGYFYVCPVALFSAFQAAILIL